MSILQQIVNHKKVEITACSRYIPIAMLEQMPLFSRQAISLSSALRKSPGIIAEFKRQSPSKQLIKQMADPAVIVPAYEKAGAAAVSVLTDSRFFGGSLTDLLLARENAGIPLLRKDFMISPYQFYEAKAYGADLVLLIAGILSNDEVRSHTELAHSLGLEVLLEIHHESELVYYNEKIDLVGINNRNLNNFEVSLEQSIRLASMLPAEAIKIAESGIRNEHDLERLSREGFSGFLIGETFMKEDHPGIICKQFTDYLNTI